MNLAIEKEHEVRAVLKTARRKKSTRKVSYLKDTALTAITLRGAFTFNEVTVSNSCTDGFANETNKVLFEKYGSPITRDDKGNILVCKTGESNTRYFVVVKSKKEIVPVINNRSLENALEMSEKKKGKEVLTVTSQAYNVQKLKKMRL